MGHIKKFNFYYKTVYVSGMERDQIEEEPELNQNLTTTKVELITN